MLLFAGYRIVSSGNRSKQSLLLNLVSPHGAVIVKAPLPAMHVTHTPPTTDIGCL